MDFLNRDEVLAAIQGFNPWWRHPVQNVAKFRRLAFESCRRWLAEPGLRRAILLSGPRRVGKTTVLQQLAAHLIEQGDAPASVLYLSLDHPLIKIYSLAKVLKLYHEHIHPQGKPTTLLLDEVQYAKEWDLELKQLVDHHPEYRIVATGSSALAHRTHVSESGVGRWLTIPVPTLSFYEYLQIRGESPTDVPEDLIPRHLFDWTPDQRSELARIFRPVQASFQRYLLVGGFPETARLTDLSLCQRLLREDVVERVLKRDMTALFRIRNVNELERIFIYLCLHTGGLFSTQGCAGDVGTTSVTVANYLQNLEQANLIYRLPPTATGGKAILKARYKVYLVDAALRNAVLLRGEEILSDPAQMGLIVETAILRHLYAYSYLDTPRITYWRDAATEREVDIIVQSPNYHLAVEVKYQEKPSITAKDGLAVYCRNQALKTAYVATKRDTDFEVRALDGLATKFLYIPAHIFCFLLGQAERLLWTK
jgi:predicted AAA+ superfamily ATPase